MAINVNHVTNIITADSGIVAMSSNFGYKNRLINGQFNISQRGIAAQTITAGVTVPTVSTGYQLDRWFGYSTGANVTIQPVAVSGTITAQITGAASVATVGLGQRIEALNSQDLAGKYVTLSFMARNSLLTTMNVAISYANTSDIFGPIGTPTKTAVTNQNFNITSTLTNYSMTFLMPAAATTGIEILFTVGAQTSGTWNLATAQLEQGNAATAFDYRPIGKELSLCQRYLEVIASTVFRWSGYNPTAAAANNYGIIPMQAIKRISPSTVMSFSATNISAVNLTGSTTSLAFSATNTAAGFWLFYNSVAATINAEL
jgi:hypothetical protein